MKSQIQATVALAAIFLVTGCGGGDWVVNTPPPAPYKNREFYDIGLSMHAIQTTPATYTASSIVNGIKSDYTLVVTPVVVTPALKAGYGESWLSANFSEKVLSKGVISERVTRYDELLQVGTYGLPYLDYSVQGGLLGNNPLSITHATYVIEKQIDQSGNVYVMDILSDSSPSAFRVGRMGVNWELKPAGLSATSAMLCLQETIVGDARTEFETSQTTMRERCWEVTTGNVPTGVFTTTYTDTAGVVTSFK